jgi:hypothetical protein
MMEQLNLSLGKKLRDEGIDAASSPRYRSALLTKVREIARSVAAFSPLGITADDVAAHCSRHGLPFEALGKAAGGIFRGGDFEPTGEWRQSPRASNHARPQRVWRLK